MSDTLVFLVAGLAFVSIAGLGWVVSGVMGDSSSVQNKRISKVANGGRLKRGKRSLSSLDQASARRKQIQSTLQDLEQHQKSQRRKTLTLKARIRQAGFSFSPMAFIITTVVLGLIVGLGAFISGQSLLVSLAAGIVVGFGLPRWVLGFLLKRRMKKFSLEFANSIDVVVRGIKSGLPLNDCLHIIAKESAAPVGPEFKKLVDGMAMGVDVDRGLEKMFERMPVPELNFFSIVLAIQKKTGGNLAEALNNLSVVLRSRKLMREKIAALSSEAKASSIIIGALPPLVMLIVYITTPDYMTPMFTEQMGHFLLLGGAVWMGLGIFVMSRMISFDF